MEPGSLIHIGKVYADRAKISIVEYSKDSFIEKDDATLQEALHYIESPQITWINVQGIHDTNLINALGKAFGMHPLVMEDILNTTQRAKLDDYKQYLYIVLRLLNYNTELQEVNGEQISILVKNDCLVTFQESDKDLFKSIRERIRKPNTKIREMGTDYLCYTIIDWIIDQHFTILEKVDDKLETLEEDLLDNPHIGILLKIERTKREIILLRKSVWPLRDLISQFNRIETPLIHESSRVFMRDVYDHTIQLIDTIESFRDIVSGMLDLYLSNLTQRTNEIMKVLTVVSTIFVPLTFLASLYGMNFDNIPELHAQYGYYILLGTMVLIASFMIYYFHKKKWF
jgi:magnesium transporter